MRLVAGLGNPGTRYRGTRHNAGFLVVDRLNEEGEQSSTLEDGFGGRLAQVRIDDQEVLLLKPQTFMNRSGESVSLAMRAFEISSEDLTVCHDDLDLPFGVVRVKRGGGSGGHRGLRSCFAELGTQDFIRIRVGIGRPPPGEDPVEYVLNRFDTEQQRELPETITLAADAAREIIRAGVTAAMNRFNRRLTDGGER